MQFPQRDLTNQFISRSYQDVVQQFLDTGSFLYLLDGYGNVIFQIPSASFGGIVLTQDQTASQAISASYAPGAPSISASYALSASNAISAAYAPGAPAISASYALSSSYSVTSTLANVSLVADSALTASLADLALTSLEATQSQFATSSLTASYISSSATFDAQTYNLTSSNSQTSSFVSASNINGTIQSSVSSSFASSSISSSHSILTDTASFVTASNVVGTIISASYSTSSSFAQAAAIAYSINFVPNTALTTTQSLFSTQSIYASSSLESVSSSWASASLSASHAIYSDTASLALQSNTASFITASNIVGTVISASYSLSSSFASQQQDISVNSITASFISASSIVTLDPTIPSQAATKNYVDQGSLYGFHYYFRSSSADVPGYNQMFRVDVPFTSSTTFVINSISSSQYALEFIAPALTASRLTIGDAQVHYHAWFNAGGNRAISLVHELWLRNTASVERFLFTSTPTTLNGDTNADYIDEIFFTSSVNTDVSERLVCKVKASTVNGTVNLSYMVDDTTNAGIFVPLAPTNFVLKAGDTMTGPLVAPSFSGSLFGTSSYSSTASFVTSSNVSGTVTSASNAISASYSLSASYAVSSSNAQSASYSITSSNTISSSTSITASYVSASSIDGTPKLAVSASFASASVSASYSLSSSLSLQSNTASFVTASNVIGTVVSASYALSSSLASQSLVTVFETVNTIQPSTSSFQNGIVIQSINLPATIGTTSNLSKTHGTIKINNKLYGTTAFFGFIYCFTSPDTDLTQVTCSLTTGSTPIYQLCYVSSSNLIYGVGANRLIAFQPNLIGSQSVVLNTGSLGSQSSICTDGTFLYVVAYSTPARFLKISLGGSVVAAQNWTGVNNGHMCIIDPTGNWFYATSADGHMAKVSTSNLANFTSSTLGGIPTDDAALLNGFLYVGSEIGNTMWKVNTSSLAASSFFADNSYGIFTDGTSSIFNTSNQGYVDYYPTADLNNPYRFYYGKQFSGIQPNELWITDGGRLVFTDWNSSAGTVFWTTLSTSSIGINNPSPTQSLDVNGSIHAFQIFGDISQATGQGWSYSVDTQVVSSVYNNNIVLGPAKGINGSSVNLWLKNGYNLLIDSGSVTLNNGTFTNQKATIDIGGGYTGSGATLSNTLYVGQSEYVVSNFGLGSDVNTSSYRGTLDILDSAPVWNVLSSSVTAVTGSGNFDNANDDNFQFSIYSYKVISGVTCYSKTPQVASFAATGTNSFPYYMAISWSAVPNVDGYKILLVDSFNGYGNDFYLTSSTPTLIYGNGLENLAINQVPMIVTPHFSGSNMYTHTSSGDFITTNAISSSKGFYGTASNAISSSYTLSSSYALTASYFTAISGSNLLYLQCNDGNTYAVTLRSDGGTIVLSVNQTPVTGTNNFLNIGNVNISSTSSYFSGSFVGTNALRANVTTITNNYTASVNDFTIVCNNTSSIGVYLTGSLPPGTILNIKKYSTASANITVTAVGTIDGQSSETISSNFSNIQVQSLDGNNWIIL